MRWLWMSLIMMVQPALAVEYACKAEQATGFRYSEQAGNWQSTDFEAGNRYLIRSAGTRSGEQLQAELEVVRFDDVTPVATCESGFQNGQLICGGIASFRLDSQSMRYLLAYMQGYWQGENHNFNNPHMEIGRCTKLD